MTRLLASKTKNKHNFAIEAAQNVVLMTLL